jgi:tRNA threonylcarbamoyladenosine biosynthesis protein TsaE
MAKSMPPRCKETRRMNFSLHDSRSTEALGRSLALALPDAAVAGAVLYLRGELGAGKTTCVRSLLRALGVTGPVRSPTYTLVDTYELARLMCVHVDLYRLQSASEVDELGLREMCGPGVLLLVEWPENGSAAVPRADLDLLLQYSGDARKAVLSSGGPFGDSWLSKLGFDTSLSPYVSNIT